MPHSARKSPEPPIYTLRVRAVGQDGKLLHQFAIPRRDG